jgi:hypothetical protein
LPSGDFPTLKVKMGVLEAENSLIKSKLELESSRWDKAVERSHKEENQLLIIQGQLVTDTSKTYLCLLKFIILFPFLFAIIIMFPLMFYMIIGIFPRIPFICYLILEGRKSLSCIFKF